MATDEWFKQRDKEMREKYHNLPEDRRILLAQMCNAIASTFNEADLSGLESEICGWISYAAIHQANTAYQEAGYGELVNCRIVSQLQPVLRAMTQEQRDEMQTEIAKVGDKPVVTAFTALMHCIKKEVDKEAKAG